MSGSGPASEQKGKTIHGVGIVGAGYWGPNLVRSFAALPNCGLMRVCDQKPGRLQYIHERFPQVELCADYDDLLSDARLDAICIATPMGTHHDLALRALDAGHDVLVEKPLATTSDDAADLVRRAEQLGRVLAVGHLFVYHPAIEALQEEVAAGHLGALCTMQSERVNLGPPTATVDVVWDLAVHDVAIALHLAGERPVEVCAFGGRYVHSTLFDAALLVIRYGSSGGPAAFSQHHVSWLSPQKVRRFHAIGTQGAGLFDGSCEPQALTLYDRGYDTRVGARDDRPVELKYGAGEARTPQLPVVEPLKAECAHFLTCVETRGRPRADGWAGLRVVQVLEAAERSLAAGSSPIRLDFLS